MSPSSGARLGPYEIISAIGAGGPASVHAGTALGELRRGPAL